MIRYRCPACCVVAERPDGDEGRVVACPGCGQKLEVPPAHFKRAVLRAEPLPPQRKRRWSDWVWRPAPRGHRENSAETLVRVAVNLFQVWFVLFVGFWGTIIALVLLGLALGRAGH